MDTDTHKNADPGLIKDVWKQETFFTISSSGRQGPRVAAVRVWLSMGGQFQIISSNTIKGYYKELVSIAVSSIY